MDYDGRGPSPELDRESEQAIFIRHDTRTPSPTGDYPTNPVSPSRSKEFSRVKKGDIEMMQLLSTGNPTTSILSDKVPSNEVRLECVSNVQCLGSEDLSD